MSMFESINSQLILNLFARVLILSGEYLRNYLNCFVLNTNLICMVVNNPNKSPASALFETDLL